MPIHTYIYAEIRTQMTLTNSHPRSHRRDDVLHYNYSSRPLWRNAASCFRDFYYLLPPLNAEGRRAPERWFRAAFLDWKMIYIKWRLFVRLMVCLLKFKFSHGVSWRVVFNNLLAGWRSYSFLFGEFIGKIICSFLDKLFLNLTRYFFILQCFRISGHHP